MIKSSLKCVVMYLNKGSPEGDGNYTKATDSFALGDLNKGSPEGDGNLPMAEVLLPFLSFE